MVFSAAIYSNTTTGNSTKGPPEVNSCCFVNDASDRHRLAFAQVHLLPVVDHQPATRLEAFDKHDPFAYTLANVPLIALGGIVAGAQEAFYKFEVSYCQSASVDLGCVAVSWPAALSRMWASCVQCSCSAENGAD